MNNLLVSFIGGFFFSMLLFIICFFIVVGIKTVINYVKKLLAPPLPPKVSKEKRISRRKPATIRSIEINPEEIDRIYVKKSS